MTSVNPASHVDDVTSTSTRPPPQSDGSNSLVPVCLSKSTEDLFTGPIDPPRLHRFHVRFPASMRITSLQDFYDTFVPSLLRYFILPTLGAVAISSLTNFRMKPAKVYTCIAGVLLLVVCFIFGERHARWKALIKNIMDTLDDLTCLVRIHYWECASSDNISSHGYVIMRTTTMSIISIARCIDRIVPEVYTTSSLEELEDFKKRSDDIKGCFDTTMAWNGYEWNHIACRVTLPIAAYTKLMENGLKVLKRRYRYGLQFQLTTSDAGDIV